MSLTWKFFWGNKQKRFFWKNLVWDFASNVFGDFRWFENGLSMEVVTVGVKITCHCEKSYTAGSRGFLF